MLIHWFWARIQAAIDSQLLKIDSSFTAFFNKYWSDEKKKLTKRLEVFFQVLK